MKNNIRKAHNHRSLRLKGYDYSREGLYFITICTKDRQHYFGQISEGEAIHNEIGRTAAVFLEEVSKHYSHALVTEHVVMPNHVHLILLINDMHESVKDGTCHGVGPCHGMALPPGVSPSANLFGKPIPGSVSVIINQYKASVKRWCNKNGYEYFQWQSRFYDHIIRNEKSYCNIVNYLRNNPKQWQDDKCFLK